MRHQINFDVAPICIPSPQNPHWLFATAQTRQLWCSLFPESRSLQNSAKSFHRALELVIKKASERRRPRFCYKCLFLSHVRRPRGGPLGRWIAPLRGNVPVVLVGLWVGKLLPLKVGMLAEFYGCQRTVVLRGILRWPRTGPEGIIIGRKAEIEGSDVWTTLRIHSQKWSILLK